MSFAHLPNMFTSLMYAPSTEESIIVSPNYQTPFGKIHPLQIRQSHTTHTSEIDVLSSVDAPKSTHTENGNVNSKRNTIKEDIVISPDEYDSFEDVSVSPSNVSIISDDDDAFPPMTQFLLQLSGVQEEVLFVQRGYHRIKKICNTLQGELIEAVLKNRDCKQSKHVTIKKCDKVLAEEHISYADDDDMHFCVDDSIKKEKSILKYLTIDNVATADYIVRYIDSFESENDYYLVTECMHNDINLLQFTEKAHKYIKSGKLKVKEYQKIIKYIFWQLSAVIHWLHDDMHCCHLNISMENIILQNAQFTPSNTGMMTISSSITAKLSDFSKSEVFKTDNNRFRCMKYSLLKDVQYLAPKIYAEQIFDARAADMWSLGMVLYHCCIGAPLYDEIGIFESPQKPKPGTGYWAVMTSNIKQWISTQNLNKYINNKMLSIIQRLLDINDSKRINALQILQHQWFKSYYKRYQHRIQLKSVTQKKQLQQQREQMKSFPFYICNY